MANSKDPLYKGYLRTLSEIDMLWEIKYSNCWITLDKPYKRGYDMSYDIRSDIKNRDDAWVFKRCVELIGGTVWSRDKKFLRKTGKGTLEPIVPGKFDISKDAYDSLHPAVKRHFIEVTWWMKNYNPWRKTYHCTLTYELVTKISAHWVYKYKEHDSVIERKLAEYSSILETKYYKFWRGGNQGRVASYAKIHNRTDRNHNNQAVRKNAKYEDCDTFGYTYRHRHSAKWEAW